MNEGCRVWERSHGFKVETTPCPLLKKCFKASGIDCRGRDWLRCDFYLNLTNPHKFPTNFRLNPRDQKGRFKKSL